MIKECFSQVENFLHNPSIKMLPYSFGIDPILDPFTDELAAEILLIEKSDLIYLKSENYILATCQFNHFDIDSPKFLCYWDVIAATITMSLTTVGCNQLHIADISLFICDSIAFQFERATEETEIGIALLYSIIEAEIAHLSLAELRLKSQIGRQALCTKLAIDIINTHARSVCYIGRVNSQSKDFALSNTATLS